MLNIYRASAGSGKTCGLRKTISTCSLHEVELFRKELVSIQSDSCIFALSLNPTKYDRNS